MTRLGPNRQTMKVVIINRSDALGGAAIASARLCLGLLKAGADARMLVLDRRTGSDRVQAVGSKAMNRWRFLAERGGIFLRNGLRRRTLFLIDTATHGVNLTKHPWVGQADVIVLGWVNQAMLSLGDVRHIASLGKPVVWVMHDMWNCTGVCHHAGTCEEFLSSCEACPLLPSGSRLAQRTWQRKRDLYAQSPITFVAVSRWLERKCRESALMGDARIRMIPNAIDVSQFAHTSLTGNPWQVEPDRKVAVMGAARLDTPGKGFDRLTAALHWLAQNQPDVARRLHLVLYGSLRDHSLLNSIPIPYTYLGYVTDLQQIYRHAHIVVCASDFESFGFTLIEGMACGCVAVTTGEGGQTDIVSHRKNGYITADLRPESLAEGLAWAVLNERQREAQHNWVAQHFALETIAKQHLQLYQQLLPSP